MMMQAASGVTSGGGRPRPLRLRCSACAAAPAAAAAAALARKPTVLAPAGGWPQLRAALACGADSVYFGVDSLNARARAANFTVAELPSVLAEVHAAGARGFVALNILLFDHELEAAEALLRAVDAAGADAVIVQDVGVALLARRVAPRLALHASTQMTVTSREGAAFAASLGAARVVAGRELSLPQLAQLRHAGCEVEAFVHGALCVSYSGQCLSSEAWGGRSSNRGQCAQACRLPYSLHVDGLLRETGDVKYLLSPADLCGLEHVPALVAAGVSCFKIEGRLKGPEYVAATTAAYRAAVDAAWAAVAAGAPPPPPPSPAALSQLAQVFARGQDESYGGLTPGFLTGSRHQALVRGRAPRHRGVLVGAALRITGDGRVVVRLGGAEGAAPLRRGAGLVFDAGAPEAEELGGAVQAMADGETGEALEECHLGNDSGRLVQLALFRGPTAAAAAQRLGRQIRAAAAAGRAVRVWRSSDPGLDARLRTAAAQPPPRRPAAAALSGGPVRRPSWHYTSLHALLTPLARYRAARCASRSAPAAARAGRRRRRCWRPPLRGR